MDRRISQSEYGRNPQKYRIKSRCGNKLDFINGDTHGHILVKLVNHDHDETIHIYRGDRFCQGILLPYGVTVSDDVTDERVGGCGSTGV